MTLTPDQQRAVTTESRDVLVIAGAGSGKTRVLCERVRHLIERQGASPSELIVLTFTRRAAAEMVSRLDGVDTRGMLLGTFHSVALTILRSDGNAIGYEPDSLTVVDQADADLLLEQVCRDLGYLKGKAWRYGLSLKQMKKSREVLYTTGKLYDGMQTEIKIALGAYKTELRRMNALDFGSILIECRRLLSEHPEALARWQSRIKHVLVDELQDEDELQYSIHHLFSPPATFFGVGDRRQSIYGFRGARPDLMTDLHPDAEVIHLNENFRSGSEIVAAANALATHMGDPLIEPMVAAVAANARQTTILPGRSGDVADEPNAQMAESVSVDSDLRWRDIAVLARMNSRKRPILRRLSGLMTERNIPHHVVGSRFAICDTDEFRQLHAALRLCVNPRDDLAFLRLYAADRFPAYSLATIREKAAVDRDSLFDAYWDAVYGAEAGAAGTLAYEIDDIGRWVRGDGPDDKEPRDNIAEAARTFACIWWGPKGPVHPPAEWWVEYCDGMTVQEALRWYALRDGQDDHTDRDEVTVCTIHAAKGLEWPIVIVAECQEGTLPSSRALREDDGEQEERRVAYVAMTRAKERLVLHYRRPEDQAQERKITRPSRFLVEARLLHDPGEVADG